MNFKKRIFRISKAEEKKLCSFAGSISNSWHFIGTPRRKKSSLTKHSEQTHVPLKVKLYVELVFEKTMLLRYVCYFSSIADVFPYSLPNRKTRYFSF